MVDLGDEDPLYTRNISNGPPDRRRVSLRWFAGLGPDRRLFRAARRRRAAGGDRPRRIYDRAPGARPRHGVRRCRGRREGRPLPPRAGDQGDAARHPDLHRHPRGGPQHRARAPLRACAHQSRRAGRRRRRRARADLPGRRRLRRRRGRGRAGDGRVVGERFHLRRRGRRRGGDQDRRFPDVRRDLRRIGGAGAGGDRDARARVGALPRRGRGRGRLAPLCRSGALRPGERRFRRAERARRSRSRRRTSRCSRRPTTSTITASRTRCCRSPRAPRCEKC